MYDLCSTATSAKLRDHSSSSDCLAMLCKYCRRWRNMQGHDNDPVIFVVIRIVCKNAEACILLQKFWTLTVITAPNLPGNWETCRNFNLVYHMAMYLYTKYIVV